MRNFLANKFMIVTLALLGLLALMGLAIGLRSMPFREAQAYGREDAVAAGRMSMQVVEDVLSIPFRIQILVWSLLILLVFLISLFISPEMRKWLLRLILRVTLTYWLLYFFFKRYPNVLEQMMFNLAPLNLEPGSSSNDVPLPTFTPPAESSWLSYGLAFGIAVVLLIVIWKGYSIWREINAPLVASPMKKLAKIVRSSLDDLSAGHDSTDVIINCYHRMSAVVAEKKQLDRKVFMTPAEFAVRLEQAGLPGEAVKRLTRLFETVRYGGQKTNPAMVNEAVACLTTILHYCGETV